MYKQQIKDYKCKQYDRICLIHKIIMQYVISNNVFYQKQFFEVTFHMVSNNACIILLGGLDLDKLLKHA